MLRVRVRVPPSRYQAMQPVKSWPLNNRRWFSAPNVPFVAVGMPALSPTMESGAILEWSKKVGDKVTPGDVIADVETDKATIGFETTDEGYIAKFLVPGGKGQIKVGAPVAIIVENAKDIPLFADYVHEGGAPAAPAAKAEAPAAPAASAPSTPAPAAPVATPEPAASGQVFASPFAKLTAKETGVNLNTVTGTGPGGRIISADVLDKAKETASRPAASVAAPVAGAAYTDITTSNIRKIIAQRLTESKQQIPHYYLNVDCNVDKLMELRATLNGLAKNGEYKLSVTDFVTKAAALALKAVPAVNSEWRGDHIRQYNNVDINMAVNTPNGLLTPVIRDADRIGLKEISQTTKDVATRAQNGKSTLADLANGTFTISNLGMFGIGQFCAVINPPQAGILAVGNIEKRVVEVAAGEFKTVNFLSVTLSADHRVVDGAVGAQWLQAFKDLIENPVKFLL